MGSGLKSADEQAFLAQLGVRVRRARARAGITRRRLSASCGVSERFLAQLESGEGNISVVPTVGWPPPSIASWLICWPHRSIPHDAHGSPCWAFGGGQVHAGHPAGRAGWVRCF